MPLKSNHLKSRVFQKAKILEYEFVTAHSINLKIQNKKKLLIQNLFTGFLKFPVGLLFGGRRTFKDIPLQVSLGFIQKCKFF